MIDHPFTRAYHVCPFCRSCAKDKGLVACWPCFRSENLRQGETPAQRKIIETHEAQLSRRFEGRGVPT